MSSELNFDTLAAELAEAMRDTPIGNDSDVILEQHEPEAPPSNTAIKMDRWSIRKGKDWLKSKDTKKVFGDDAKGQEYVAADFLAAAWEPSPTLVSKCVDERRKHFLDQMMQSAEYKSLHRSTQLDELASELAATSFAQAWVALVQQPEPEDQLDKDAQALGASQKACQQAKEQVQGLNDARDALGIGNEQGNGGALDAKHIRKLFMGVRENRNLRRIMELAGKYRRLAQSLQASKACHGVDEIVGVEYGDDLSRVTASEFSLLSEIDTELEFLRKFAEGELEMDEMSATEAEAKGPIVVVLDESGSMSGERIAHAKAMALAMAWIARHQKRYCALVSFSSGKTQTGLVIPPGETKENELLDWLASFQSGGTDPYVPFQAVPEQWNTTLGCPKGKTDMILITDAAISIPENMKKAFKAWKSEEQVKLDSIILSSQAGCVADVSDQFWLVNELDIDTSGVAECLSV